MNLVKSRTPIGSGAKRILVASLTGVLLLAPSLIQGVARAENGPRIAPAARLEVSPAAVRGPAEWDRDANLQPSPAVRIVPINRPTLDEASYRAAKAAADTAGASATGKGDSPAPLGPPLNNGNYTGVNESTAGFFFPPDTEGVVGTSHLVEVTNSHIDIYTKAIPGVLLKSVSLATFFGTTETLFDPRAIFDPIWKRYIITADAFPISATVQHFWWAISLTSNANGSYFVYAPNVDFGGTSSFFFDFPMVGNDQDGVIFTANIFNPGFVGADEFSVAKAALYNGLGFGVPVFTGLCGTLATPNVLDNNGNAFLVCAPGGTGITTVSKYTLTNSSRPNLTALAGPASITVPAYSIPPSVTQPGLSSTADHLDSSDARFSNVSSQIGTSLFQTHTILDITATPQVLRVQHEHQRGRPEWDLLRGRSLGRFQRVNRGEFVEERLRDLGLGPPKWYGESQRPRPLLGAAFNRCAGHYLERQRGGHQQRRTHRQLRLELWPAALGRLLSDVD